MGEELGLKIFSPSSSLTVCAAASRRVFVSVMVVVAIVASARLTSSDRVASFLRSMCRRFLTWMSPYYYYYYSFRLKGYKENRLGHFWELSYDIYDRVEVNLHDRMMYTSFMKKNPLIAKRKKINLIGFI